MKRSIYSMILVTERGFSTPQNPTKDHFLTLLCISGVLYLNLLMFLKLFGIYQVLKANTLIEVVISSLLLPIFFFILRWIFPKTIFNNITLTSKDLKRGKWLSIIFFSSGIVLLIACQTIIEASKTN